MIDTGTLPTEGTISNRATVRLFDEGWRNSRHADAIDEGPRSGYILRWFRHQILEEEAEWTRGLYTAYLDSLEFPYHCRLSEFRETFEAKRYGARR